MLTMFVNFDLSLVNDDRDSSVIIIVVCSICFIRVFCFD